MAFRILSVSYDAGLAATRAMLLRANGYEVETSESLAEALEHCRAGGFDLAIIGHSIPHPHKLEMISSIRAICSAPIVALTKVGEAELPGADYRVIAADGPEPLMRIIESLATGQQQRQTSAS